jgi:hypothetical protein
MTRAPYTLDRYADMIVAALAEHGPLGVSELRTHVKARFWGPGVFGAALRHARDQGRVRRAGRRRYETV